MKNTSDINKLVEHFFRQESGKMISVLTGIFGSNNLILVEDIVQDTLVEAISNWTYKGVPENHVAWLYTVAKNKTLNALKREKNKEKFISERLYISKTNRLNELDSNDLFSEESISDDQLRMMFMCCHPSITKDSQIALILKTLCGFNISEIAKSFLTNNESINKRLVRARKTIKKDDIPFEVPSKQQLDKRVDAVLEAIYLLFNEGYSASNGNELIRTELCQESIRLAEMVANHKSITNKSNAYALIALMQLNSSRFKAREDTNGNIITLSQQNRSLWDYHIMEQGFSNLKKATQNQYISNYHILATISAYHCSAKDFASTDWKSILTLYDKLLTIDNSPIVILNRAIVLSKIGDIQTAFQELTTIEHDKIIKFNYLFYAAKAEFHVQINEYNLAIKTLTKAIELAPLSKEKQMLEHRLKKYFDKKNNNDVPNS
ncbi:sigma-70 family RNA polymerase sigma factor [uncultured Polaribacter sp.]|uniref:RNA polymerase sigma factor n=1 Tax=uncultured Polaribacter sp. TaxID=174711 RepID=UPI0026321198|nr:sigma-70 family RNA polymerase sigma factor [uncultured Polaribacter sp.]